MTDEPKIEQVLVRLDQDTAEALRQLAQEEDRALAQMARVLLREALMRRRAPPVEKPVELPEQGVKKPTSGVFRRAKNQSR